MLQVIIITYIHIQISSFVIVFVLSASCPYTPLYIYIYISLKVTTVGGQWPAAESEIRFQRVRVRAWYLTVARIVTFSNKFCCTLPYLPCSRCSSCRPLFLLTSSPYLCNPVFLLLIAHFGHCHTWNLWVYHEIHPVARRLPVRMAEQLKKVDYSWIGHRLQTGLTLAFLLSRSDFKSGTSFGFISQN